MTVEILLIVRSDEETRMAPTKREADMTWILVRIGVESPIFALQEHVSTVVVGRGTDCTLRCPGMFSRQLQQLLYLLLLLLVCCYTLELR